ncbi:MAG: hypothetical protein U1F57_02370 [bacterium]
MKNRIDALAPLIQAVSELTHFIVADLDFRVVNLVSFRFSMMDNA